MVVFAGNRFYAEPKLWNNYQLAQPVITTNCTSTRHALDKTYAAGLGGISNAIERHNTVMLNEAKDVNASVATSSSTGAKKRWPLKQLLKAGYELLQPPAPLSNDSNDLRRQLDQSEKTLADDEHHREPKDRWCDCDSAAGGDHARDTKEELRCLVTSRTEFLLVEMQGILEKEYWPVEYRDGLVPGDCR